MFNGNGLTNIRYLLPFIVFTLLVASGCTDNGSGNFVKFKDLKKNVTTTVKGECCQPPPRTRKFSPVIVTPKRLPVIAMRPQKIDLIEQNNLLKPSTKSKITLLVKNRSFNKEGDALRISYDDIDLLKVLNMEPVPKNAVDYFPDWLSQLDGKRVRVRGFMIPHHLETGITVFILARDNDICCFGRSPKIYDLIEVRMRLGRSTRYIQGRPFDVVGTFHIDVEYEDNMFYRFYTMTESTVIQK